MFNKDVFKSKLYENYNAKTYKQDNFYQEKIKVNNHIYLYKIRNVAAIIAICTLIGTGVYATYQAIKKGPDYNWVGDEATIKFNNEYEKFSVEINEQIAKTNNDSILTLEEINYDGGFAVFELKFDVSDKDKEYFELGEKIFTDEEIELYKSEDIGYFTSRMNSYDETLGISKEEYVKKYKEIIENINKSYEMSRELRHSFEFINNCHLYSSNSKQNVEKITENEYKIYYYYFISDEEFDENEKAIISLENMRLMQSYDREILKDNDSNEAPTIVNNERSG